MSSQERQDGTFSIFYKDGWACLHIIPPENEGRPCYAEDIEGKLKILGVPHIRKQQIFNCLEKAAGKVVRLIEWPAGELLGPKVEITVSEDFLEVLVSVQPPRPGGEPVTVSLLAKRMAEQNIVTGIDSESLQDLVRNKWYRRALPAAHGTAPVHQKQAEVEYFFDTERGKPFKNLD